MSRILITGSLGQIGTELSSVLRQKYGKENVICTDIRKPTDELYEQGPYKYLDVLNFNSFNQLVVDYDIDWIVHNAGILSAVGEKNPKLAMDVNIRGFENAIQTAKNHGLRILSPSSIAAFGPSTPKINTPDLTIMRPTTIYGVSKVYIELLGEYYHKKWDVDFRSIRYPGIISSKAPPGGGTTDYAISIFHDAILGKTYQSFLDKNATLPMMYMPDCLRGTSELLATDNENLKQRTFNLAAISFSPSELADAIRKYIPDFEIEYKPDFRQKIADSWPKSIDDHNAREQWGWKHEYDLDAMTRDMIINISKKYNVDINKFRL